MASPSSFQRKVVTEFPGAIRVYDDGTVERLRDTDFAPPSFSSSDGVSSKDVVIVPESNFSARLYLPHQPRASSVAHRKLPLLLYFHGGGLCVASAFCGKYHRYVSRLGAESQAVVVSFDYRLAPEHPIPAAYEDSWAGLHWAITSRRASNGPEPWLNHHADFDRVFLVGDSAGANIVHNLAMAVGDSGIDVKDGLLWAALVHPYFWGSKPIGSEPIYPQPEVKAAADRLWPFVCPSNPGNDDPRINPEAPGAPSLAGLGCRRVLVCVAGKDLLRDRWRLYDETLRRSGWAGAGEIFETEGEGHGFHLYRRLATFFNCTIPMLP